MGAKKKGDIERRSGCHTPRENGRNLKKKDRRKNGSPSTQVKRRPRFLPSSAIKQGKPAIDAQRGWKSLLARYDSVIFKKSTITHGPLKTRGGEKTVNSERGLAGEKNSIGGKRKPPSTSEKFSSKSTDAQPLGVFYTNRLLRANPALYFLALRDKNSSYGKLSTFRTKRSWGG